MNFLSPLAPHAHWALRLPLAATFLYHGIGKFPVAAFSEAMSMPVAMVWPVAIVEIIAGIALITGAFNKEILTRLGGLIVIVIMIINTCIQQVNTQYILDCYKFIPITTTSMAEFGLPYPGVHWIGQGYNGSDMEITSCP